jgi:hypothetical protein
LHTDLPLFTRQWRPRKKKMAWGPAQPLEKAQNGQGNQRKSKPFPLIFLGQAWLDFAGFG